MKKILLGIGFIIVIWLFLNPYFLFPDGQGSFSYLSSLFHDGDLQLYNDFLSMRIPIPLALSDTGYISNNWPFGAAFFWSPFYVIAKILADPRFAPTSEWFWYWVNFGTMFYGVLAALMLWGLNKPDEKGKGQKTLIVAAALLGTPAFFFFIVIPSNAIGIAAFASTAFIWYWLRSFKEPDRIERYILLGLILGAATMVRQQEALWGLVPATELFVRLLKREINAAKALGRVAALVLCFLVAFSPQMLIWKTVNGSFLAAPSKFNLSWKYFALDKTLFSSYHGLLFWTPIYFTGFAGLIIGAFRKPTVYLGLVAVFLAQLLTNSFCVAFWEGYSFGLRQMTSLLPAVFLGLMEFHEHFRNGSALQKTVTGILIYVPALWTMGLVSSFYSGFVDLLNPMSGRDLLSAQQKGLLYIQYLPGKILANPRPQAGGFALMLIAGLIFFCIAVLAKKEMDKGRQKVIAGILLATVAAFNLIIANAARSKPDYEIPKDQVVTQQDLDDFFIKQAEEAKSKYHLR